MNNDPDLPLIDRVLAGEQNVYAQIIDRHKRYAFTIAMKILQNRPEAEEAAQDSFIKAFHNLKAFNREARFSTWLYRIAFNTAISYKRKHKHKHHDIETAHVPIAGEAEGSLEKNDKKRFLEIAIGKLSESDRTALTLFYLQEFSLEEIADITNTPSNTIKVRIHRARQRVADELKMILHKEALTL